VLDRVACIYITEWTKRDVNHSKAGEDQLDASCQNISIKMCQGMKGTSSVQQTGKINVSRKERNIFRTTDRKDKCVKEGKEHLPYNRPER